MKMKLAAWMAAGCAVSWLAATAVVGRDAAAGLLLGMLGPLAAAAATWIAVVRAHRRSPRRVTRVLVVGFAAKMVFFAAYVALALRRVADRPLPFVISFTAYLIGLYVAEGLALRRLGAGST